MILYLSPDLKDGQCCYFTCAVFKMRLYIFIINQSLVNSFTIRITP